MPTQPKTKTPSPAAVPVAPSDEATPVTLAETLLQAKFPGIGFSLTPVDVETKPPT
jgi:hypothetical protein